MQFPTLVYKKDGPYNAGGSKTYDFREVKDSASLDEFLEDGWLLTLAEAMKPTPKKPIIVIAENVTVDQKDDQPPSRNELEQQAKELNIKFDGRTTDKRLLEQINEALSAD